MKFGLFYEISVPRPWGRETEKTVYDNCLEQVALADSLGFDSVWAVEHHFLEEYSHCPAPELFFGFRERAVHQGRLAVADANRAGGRGLLERVATLVLAGAR